MSQSKCACFWNHWGYLIFFPNLLPFFFLFIHMQSCSRRHGSLSLHTLRLHPLSCHCALPPLQKTDTPALPLSPSSIKVKHTMLREATINNVHELYLWQRFKITDTECFTDNKTWTDDGEIRKSDTDSRLILGLEKNRSFKKDFAMTFVNIIYQYHMILAAEWHRNTHMTEQSTV